MVRDAYGKDKQINFLAGLSAAMALCALIAPVIGGGMQIYFGWRSVFYLLIVFTFILLILIQNQLKETHEIIGKFSLREAISNYKMLLKNRLFISYSLAIGFVWCNYFAFTLEAPFLLIKNLGLSTLSFGLLYSLIISSYLAGTLLTKRFANKAGWDYLILVAAGLCVVGSLLMMLALGFFSLNWITLSCPMIIVMMGVGIIIPCTQAAVMQPFPAIAGTASGLFFFIQMGFGGVCGLIIQMFTRKTAMPLAVLMMSASILLFVSFYSLIWSKREADKGINFRI
jgi:MFS transporter, DHA1 family, multidrug resistance protein